MQASKIIFATDFSPATEEMLKHAISVARGIDALLIIVHVAARRQAEIKTDDDNLRRLHDVIVSNSQVACEHQILYGDPVREICEFAQETEAQLIVMGSHGRSGFSRLLMGSVAEGVSRKAPCPVLTWRVGAQVTESHELQKSSHGQGDSSAVINPFQATRAEELLERAVDLRATDVHLDSTQDAVEVRFRIDGRLEHYCQFDHGMGHALINQLKILAGLDISEPFCPKEARLHLEEPNLSIDVRVTVSRSRQGEAMALRVLDRDRLIRPLHSLGVGVKSQSVLEHIIEHGEGLLLVTGPTGSGKTTTLYSMLHALDDGTRNIVSIEDPVEFAIPTFRQIDVDLRHGITIAEGLRTILRMDPDIVLVGEIRDAEAGVIAMRAASSGKRIFSSLHTRDVASTVTALRDLQLDNQSIAANLSAVMSQRLVRRLCSKCSTSSPPTSEEIEIFSANQVDVPAELGRSAGCSSCRQTGFNDRIGVFEIATFTGDLAGAISSNAAEAEIHNILRDGQTPSLLMDALDKVAQRVTTMEEVQSMVWKPPFPPSRSPS